MKNINFTWNLSEKKMFFKIDVRNLRSTIINQTLFMLGLLVDSIYWFD